MSRERSRGGRRGRAVAGTLAVALLVAAVAACSDSFGPGDSDAAVVFGRVSAASGGAPVADARVEVTAFSGICGSNVFSSVATRSDSAGHYVTSVISFRRRLRSCVEVRGVPPEGSDLSPRTVRLPSVSPSGDGLDSLQVNLALDSAGSG